MESHLSFPGLVRLLPSEISVGIQTSQTGRSRAGKPLLLCLLPALKGQDPPSGRRACPRANPRRTHPSLCMWHLRRVSDTPLWSTQEVGFWRGSGCTGGQLGMWLRAPLEGGTGELIVGVALLEALLCRFLQHVPAGGLPHLSSLGPGRRRSR